MHIMVDDEAVIRDIARQMLQTFGYRFLWLQTGRKQWIMRTKPGKIKVMIMILPCGHWMERRR